jgi:valyl-tRNA synthetase
MYAPYLPHITETIYQKLYKQHEQAPSLHQMRYQNTQILYNFDLQATTMHTVIELVMLVRKLKTEHKLSLKTALATMHVYAPNQAICDALAEHDQLIRGVTQAIIISYKTHNNQQSTLTEIDGTWHAQIVLQPGKKTDRA